MKWAAQWESLGSRTAIGSPLSLLPFLQEPHGPFASFGVLGKIKQFEIPPELGWKEESWERERKDRGETQEEELWLLKLWWGQVGDSVTASTRDTEMSKMPKLLQGDRITSLLKLNVLFTCKSFSLGP